MPNASAVRVGDAVSSVDELYRSYARQAWRVAYSITADPDDAADAVAEAFARLVQAEATERLSHVEDVRPYLIAITRHAAIDLLRRAGRTVPTDVPVDGLHEEAPAPGPSEQLVAGEDRTLVTEALTGLPPRWRAVLWLTEVEGMPPREVAALLGLSANTAAQLAVRARAGLRQGYVQRHVRNHASGDCAWTVERLGAMASGDLTVHQANRVRSHLAGCADCRERLAELNDLGLSLRRALTPLAFVGGVRLRRPRRRAEAGWRARTGPLAAGAPSPSTFGAIAEVAASPVVQHVAAAVMAGVVALGLGVTVARHRDVKATPPPATTAQVAVPGPSVPAVSPLPPVTSTLPGQGPSQSTDPGTSTTGPASGTPTAADPASTASADPATTPRSLASPRAADPGPPGAAAVGTPSSADPGSPAAPGGSPPPPSAGATVPFVPRGPLASAERSTVARAVSPEVAVYDSPGGALRRTLANPRPSGAPLVFLVRDSSPGWLQVLLPVRPNGSTGWIRSVEVSLTTIDFKIVVELGAHRITAYEGTEVLVSEPIGVGTAEAPTPGGLYYVTELFRPLNDAGVPDPAGPYGAYAYGLSGYSEVLYDFAGGDGQFGIHGTNDPAGLGHDVSHGCIRMSNAGITRLAGILPLGVPVQILA